MVNGATIASSPDHAQQSMMVSTNWALLVLSASAFPIPAPISSGLSSLVPSLLAISAAVAIPLVVAAIPPVTFVPLSSPLPASARSAVAW
ncbi:hypothetical protein PtA15_9A262 [Puccinia triticina]|uniref:Uncharacterized protein n=1 Tax=Puccinia triticina TaxID=208348 RepID=A0ABY7CZK9_9BASI|nr:uncharacterized protein PtA15_6A621 [Puccinia triticina]XP_053023692.1 uncharacterized protein PtA15_9A262 [Puccinia triticina]WAQ85991.1 hypothetical protein PtA15_6A621 [Puccinia triticina]WAQ88137.1 hypothetical protein PtA15_9A262 [Puccinia triticina]